eukprot:scaffold15200_cov111-Isochrysis_galbana.AAC.6
MTSHVRRAACALCGGGGGEGGARAPAVLGGVRRWASLSRCGDISPFKEKKPASGLGRTELAPPGLSAAVCSSPTRPHSSRAHRKSCCSCLSSFAPTPSPAVPPLRTSHIICNTSRSSSPSLRLVASARSRRRIWSDSAAATASSCAGKPASLPTRMPYEPSPTPGTRRCSIRTSGAMAFVAPLAGPSAGPTTASMWKTATSLGRAAARSANSG